MIHFHLKDLSDKKTTDELISKIKMIKNKDNNINIIFIIRDASETKILKFKDQNNNLKKVDDLCKFFK